MSSMGGTQSPPLEATGEHEPMGASSVDRVGKKVEVVKDVEQRKQYFQPEEDAEEDAEHKKQYFQSETDPNQAPKRQGGQSGSQKLGESIRDKQT